MSSNALIVAAANVTVTAPAGATAAGLAFTGKPTILLEQFPNYPKMVKYTLDFSKVTGVTTAAGTVGINVAVTGLPSWAVPITSSGQTAVGCPILFLQTAALGAFQVSSTALTFNSSIETLSAAFTSNPIATGPTEGFYYIL